MPRPEKPDRPEQRHRADRRGLGPPVRPAAGLQRVAVAVQRLESVRQDRAVHAEDHVADRALRLQRVVPVQGRDVLGQADLGGPLDQGDARLRQAVPGRLDGLETVVVVGNRVPRL